MTPDPGSIGVLPVPECPEHGEMHLRVACDPADVTIVFFVYVCHGFDGEGCDRLVPLG